MKHAWLIARLVFGAWMVASGLNHFFGPFYAVHVATNPMSAQLLDALVHIGLLDVAMGIQLAGGVLVLLGVAVPAALCVLMPISLCAAYWAVVLEQQPFGALLALSALALNGLLMLGYLDYYRGVLERHPRAIGEA